MKWKIDSIVATKTINIHYSADFGLCFCSFFYKNLNQPESDSSGKQKADGKSFIRLLKKSDGLNVQKRLKSNRD